MDELSTLSAEESDPSINTEFADPGPFKAKIDVVPLKKDPTSVFSGVAEYRSFVRGLQGIRVYRNGFGIKLSSDWLKLSSQWTGATSWYTIRPENSLGHIDLTAEHNASLEETTNREAFRDTPAYRGFMRILGQWIKSAGLAQEVVGRGYVEYSKVRGEELANVPSGTSPASLVQRAIKAVNTRASAPPLGQQVREEIEQARRQTAELAKVNESLSGTLFADEEHSRSTAERIENLGKSLDATAAAIAREESSNEGLDRERRTLELLKTQMEILQSQTTDAWELVSLGLSAEAISHEIKNITDSLHTRTRAIQKYLNRTNKKDETIWQYTDSVAGIANTLSKQISRLDPSMRYVRETRNRLDMAVVAADSVKHFMFRWADQPITAHVDVESNFNVRMNPGKVSQILDNLLLNSEHWLTKGLDQNPKRTGNVFLKVARPYLYVSDSGPGVDPAVEELLFEPFITTKVTSEGRGLGLFVVKQLLAIDGVSIELTQSRNADGRRYIFRIDFTSVIED